MAGVVGVNYDNGGYILDPTLPQVIQDYKQVGPHPQLGVDMMHVIGGFRTVQIPTASVLTLNTKPVQLVPACGANTLIVPTLVVATLVYNSTTYAMNASGASLKYATDGSGTSTGFTLSQAFIQNSSAGTYTQVVNQSSSATYSPVSTDWNTPLTLIAATSDPTTGNSDLYVRVYYRVVGIPLGPTSTSGYVYP